MNPKKMTRIEHDAAHLSIARAATSLRNSGPTTTSRTTVSDTCDSRTPTFCSIAGPTLAIFATEDHATADWTAATICQRSALQQSMVPLDADGASAGEQLRDGLYHSLGTSFRVEQGFQ